MSEFVASAGSSLLGICAILAIAFLLSSGKRKIKLRVVGAAFGLQALMALLVLRTDFGVGLIQGLSNGVIALLDYSKVGITSVFGPMESNPFANTFVIAALPVIVFFAAIVSILYHFGIMQRLVRWVGGAIGWITGISQVEALGAAANIFVGQSESPLVVRPYLEGLSPSRLFTLMSVGMAGVAGTILAAYASFIGNETVPYLLAAAFMSAPGGILMAKIIMPDDIDEGSASPSAQTDDVIDEKAKPFELPKSRISAGGPAAMVESGKAEEVTMAETFEEGHRPANMIEAAAQGTQTGVKLAVAVGAMVMVFVALVALANGMLGGVGAGIASAAEAVGAPFAPATAEWLSTLSLQKLLGYIFAPVMFLIGIPDWNQAQIAGGLFGTKIVLNEFVAFIDLGAMTGDQLTERSRAIAERTAASAAEIATALVAHSDETTMASAGLELAATELTNTTAAMTQTRAAAEHLREQAEALGVFMDSFELIEDDSSP